MKLEELKAEAEKHGYVLTKKREHVRFEPCICGHNRRTQWTICSNEVGYQYQCNHCGFRGGIGSTERAARIAWNEAVEKAGETEL